jgi:hypothetical protein
MKSQEHFDFVGEKYEQAFPRVVEVDGVIAFRADTVRVASADYNNSEGLQWSAKESARYMYYDGADRPVFVVIARREVGDVELSNGTHGVSEEVRNETKKLVAAA